MKKTDIILIAVIAFIGIVAYIILQLTTLLVQPSLSAIPLI